MFGGGPMALVDPDRFVPLDASEDWTLERLLAHLGAQGARGAALSWVPAAEANWVVRVRAKGWSQTRGARELTSVISAGAHGLHLLDFDQLAHGGSTSRATTTPRCRGEFGCRQADTRAGGCSSMTRRASPPRRARTSWWSSARRPRATPPPGRSRELSRTHGEHPGPGGSTRAGACRARRPPRVILFIVRLPSHARPKRSGGHAPSRLTGALALRRAAGGTRGGLSSCSAAAVDDGGSCASVRRVSACCGPRSWRRRPPTDAAVAGWPTDRARTTGTSTLAPESAASAGASARSTIGSARDRRRL